MDAAQKLRILVAEDDLAIQQVLCFFLRHHGFDTLSTDTGNDTIRAIPDYEPHLLILDLLMSSGSGWDVLNWLREQQRIPRLPVIVLSALVNLKEQVQGFEEGAVEYITKPLQPSLLMERVQTILTMSYEQRALLQRKRRDERRKTLDRVSAPLPAEWEYL